MRFHINHRSLLLAFLCSTSMWSGDTIPDAAWKRGLGVPLEHPGTKKPIEGLFDDGYGQGAPVGGFGAGTFSRTYRGDFARWHVKTAVHKYETVPANQFAVYQKSEGDAQAVAQVLYTGHPKDHELSAWKWDYPVGAGDYRALYPKAWFDYQWDKFPAHLVLEQFSPLLPNNYRESSYPLAVYRWHATNPSPKKVTVSVLLSWTNMIGWFRDLTTDFKGQLTAGDVNRYREQPLGVNGSGGLMKGIVFDRRRSLPVTEDWDGQFAIAGLEAPGVQITHVTTFDPSGDGREVWQPFAEHGKLSNLDRDWISSGDAIAGALAITFTLDPGEKKTIPMVIAWDLPVVQFGGGRKWLKRYTDFFGTSGTHAWEIAMTGLLEESAWSDAIDQWQAPIVQDGSKPLWYRGMLFNEMYILADGGSLWGRPLGDDLAPRTFSYLDIDYLSYSPLDVLFYGSMPLIKWWPELDKGILRQFAETVPQEDLEQNPWAWETWRTKQMAFRIRKSKGVVPHDLGSPREDPFFKVNQFYWQDTSRWKDVNSKFVLMVYRDFILSGAKDLAFLKDTWPSVQEALAFLDRFDSDGDGLPENDGFPDQTYDEWVMKGTSAYCGGLYLSALKAAAAIARRLDQADAAKHYEARFAKAQPSYLKKLWNKEYFRYDTDSEYRDNIQSDQLAGQWYANLTGLGDIVPKAMRVSALHKIFDFNVMKFADGSMGAVNGMAPDGHVPDTNEQVQEVWTGTTFALASEMLGEGLRDQAFRAAWGVYHITYETKGYWFRTPEAWDINGRFRASMYMRPGAIWAMELMPAPK